MNVLFTILITVILFGIVIFVHEFGHFFTAKLCRVRVNEFAMGMGPKLFSFQKGETRYSLRLLPIGGFCQMEGEDEESKDPRAFSNRPVWQRVLIVAAGAIMNLILGFVVVCLMVSLFGGNAFSSTTVAEFDANATTQQSGLMVGDKIVRINDRKVNIDRDIIFALQRDEDMVVSMVVERDGKEVALDAVKFAYTDVHDEKTNTDYKSFVIDFRVLPVKKTVTTVLRQSFYESVVIARAVWVSLVDLLGDFSLNKVSGFVGVGEVIGEAAGLGFDYLLNIMAFITINLGIFNLLPVPALDGGRLLFLLIEAVIRRPIPKKYEGMIHAIGLVLLFGFMIVITFKDIFMLFTR